MPEFHYDKLMQRIGEYVVSFQWMENKFRDIGWLIDDPERANWPPATLRNLTNFDLLNTVATKYCDLMDTLNIGDAEDRKIAFIQLVEKCHEIRKTRNNLLHSAVIEIKAGGDVMGILRSNPKITFDPATGDPVFDHEELTEDTVVAKMKEMGEPAMALNMTYIQLIHWAPFTQLQSTA
ncbi:MAG TPA: hypothetical protein PKA76_19440 [Pirellulaceae bacterium]|nr:hypothetical protein [Pirellulaceae bacterium]